jgi:cytochrome c oxidase assembly protein subunit 11
MGRPSKTRRTALLLMAVPPVMLGMAYAAVPLYDWFCRVTGYGGTTSVAAEESAEILDETVTVRFDSNVAPEMPWRFEPKVREMDLRIGETGMMFYEAYNPTDQPVAGTASYNVSPFSAGPFFAKIACFCFEMQVLQPGERVEMPVTFFVDPRLVEDREAGEVRSITLSYTMHRSELPEETAPEGAQAANAAAGTLTAEAATGIQATR